MSTYTDAHLLEVMSELKPGESRVQGWDRFWSRLEDRFDEDHGRPHYYECKVPDCTRQGHKCYRAGCTDPVHTHPLEGDR